MKYASAPFLVMVSMTSAFFCEFVLWALLYRTSHYQNLIGSMSRTCKKVESMKATNSNAAAKTSKGRKLGKQETFLKQTSRDLSFVKMKSNLVVGLVLFVLYRVLSSTYDGVPVAKLPFEPFGWITKLSHRNLPGDDLTDCSMAFLYVLCSISCRVNIQKLLGFAPPRMLSQVMGQMGPMGQMGGGNPWQ
mmetsp:Transcript_12836/g.24386  ORF Transcript_12836/g.24386 Transcript_12836/m.24386 type:complete len:190 (+) Transcript_12836:104-673(+)